MLSFERGEADREKSKEKVDTSRASRSSAKIVEKMPHSWQVLRKEVLRQIPSKVEGLNTTHMREFFESFPGLRLNDYVVFEEDDLPKLRELLRPVDMLREDSFAEGKEVGKFLPFIKLSFIKRDRKWEDVNGTLYTEGNLVHELAHSSSEYSRYTKMPTGTTVPRFGFSVSTEDFANRRGGFLEEGFADLMRGYYVERYATDEYKEKILRSFGLDASSSLNVCLQGDKDYKYLPVKYFVLNPRQRKITFAISSPAAFGLELLMKKNEELYPAILSARHDVESLRDVAKIINGIKPGLYSALQKLEYSHNDFNRGLKYIIDEVYGGKLKLNDQRELVDGAL